MNERKPPIYLNNENIAGVIAQPNSEETTFLQSFLPAMDTLEVTLCLGVTGIALSLSVQSALDKSEVGEPVPTREAQRGLWLLVTWWLKAHSP